MPVGLLALDPSECQFYRRKQGLESPICRDGCYVTAASTQFKGGLRLAIVYAIVRQGTAPGKNPCLGWGKTCSPVVCCCSWRSLARRWTVALDRAASSSTTSAIPDLAIARPRARCAM